MMNYNHLVCMSILCTALLLSRPTDAAQEPGMYQISITKGPGFTGPLYYSFYYTQDKNGKTIIPDENNRRIGAISKEETTQIVNPDNFPAVQNTMLLGSKHQSAYIYLFVSTKADHLSAPAANLNKLASHLVPYKPGYEYRGNLVFTVNQKKDGSLVIKMKDKPAGKKPAVR